MRQQKISKDAWTLYRIIDTGIRKENTDAYIYLHKMLPAIENEIKSETEPIKQYQLFLGYLNQAIVIVSPKKQETLQKIIKNIESRIK